jgi:hypothetical protein
VYPDAALGVPEDGFFQFETPAPKGYTFAERGAPKLAGFYDRSSMLSAAPVLGRLFQN